MRNSGSIVAVATGMLLLGACSGSKPADGTAQDNAATPSQAAAATAPAASPAPATPKQGLWEMKISAVGMPQPQVMKVCVGAPPPGSNGFTPPPAAGQKCSKNAVTPTATGYAIESECTMHGMTVTGKGTISGDFSSNYKIDMASKMSGPNLPPAAQQEMKTTIAAQYLGACPADMKPGESKRG